MRWLLSVLLVSCLAAPRCDATTLEIHGTLGDGRGAPQSGAYLLRFSLSDTAPGSPEAWSDAIYVRVLRGEFHVVLGKTKPIPEKLFTAGYRLAIEAPAALGWQASATSAVAALTPEQEAKLGEVRRLRAGVAHEARPPKPSPAPPQEAPPAAPVATQAVYPVPARTAVAAPPSAQQEPSQPAPAKETARPAKRLEAVERTLAPKPPQSTMSLYEVQPEDSLQKIASKLWGDPGRWSLLYDANSDRIQRGGYLTAGQRLIVPGVK